MLTFVSKYATAAHLALLTVAPLFLFPLLGEGEVAKVLLWLSLLALVWIVMAPTPRRGEYPHNARARFAEDVVFDPFSWFLAFLLLFCAVRALNGGIMLWYDVEMLTWSVKPAVAEILPGCVDGAGFLPFSTAVALVVVLLGLKHSLDGETCMVYLSLASLLAGVSAVVAWCLMAGDVPYMEKFVKCEYYSASFLGTAYGIHMICGLVALFSCAERKWGLFEFFAALGTIACAAGLVMFSPPATMLVFGVVFVVMVAVSFLLCARILSSVACLRCTVAVIVSMFAVLGVFFLADPGSALYAKREALNGFVLFPEGFWRARAALSASALSAWKHGPWLGSGLGSFSFDMRVADSAADWSVVSPLQQSALNGWWQLLVERGVVGVLVFAIVLGFMMWSYTSRLVFTLRVCRWRSVHILGIVLMLALTALTFIDCSFMRTDVLLAFTAAFAVSAAAFPAERLAALKRKKED